MNTIHRLFYLACEGRYKLPDKRLMGLISKFERDLLTDAVEYGLGSGTNYAQLKQLWEMGKDGPEKSESEFRGLISKEIDTALTNAELAHGPKMKYMGLLAAYFYGKGDIVEPDEATFNDKADPLVRFETGFTALDLVLGEPDYPGVINGVYTLQAKSGVGKSALSLWLAAHWRYGSVWFYEPEMGKRLTLHRKDKMPVTWDVNRPPLIKFGSYDPEIVIEEAIRNPDPGRLYIFESLKAVCGPGDDPNNRARYVRFYNSFVELKNHGMMVWVTTHLKAGDSGDTMESAAGSSVIGERSDGVITLKQEATRPDGTKRMSLLGVKNRTGPEGNDESFIMDHRTNSIVVERPKQEIIE